MALQCLHGCCINSEDPWQHVVPFQLLLLHVWNLEVVASIVLEDLIHYLHVSEPVFFFCLFGKANGKAWKLAREKQNPEQPRVLLYYF